MSSATAGAAVWPPAPGATSAKAWRPRRPPSAPPRRTPLASARAAAHAQMPECGRRLPTFFWRCVWKATQVALDLLPVVAEPKSARDLQLQKFVSAHSRPCPVDIGEGAKLPCLGFESARWIVRH